MFQKDLMLDDQALILNLEGDRLLIVTGCAHSGVVNAVKWALKLTGKSRAYGF